MKKALFQKKTTAEQDGERKKIKIALAGVPNVGKSSVFNELTGLRRHTGNWTGKTVDCAEGAFCLGSYEMTVADIPGTYSLFARSAEEMQAREYIIDGGADVILAVCDMTSPERSLPLVLQLLEITNRVVVFFNLADEAEKKNISVDTKKLSEMLGVPVISGSARNKKGIKEAVLACINVYTHDMDGAFLPTYCEEIENYLEKTAVGRDERRRRVEEIYASPASFGFEEEDRVRDEMSSMFVSVCDKMCAVTVTRKESVRNKRERSLDRLFTGKLTAFPIMFLLLTFVFWLTLQGANYPSEALWTLLSGIGALIGKGLFALGLSARAVSFVTDGLWGVSARIVSVMLPPMAIFFPLFTLLEDFGYLPRVAFNLDRCFKKCGGCGKQALCMCMGLGCNAVGISGCRIIDSRRERLTAIFTNAFIPCNGRFPMLITLIAVFLVPSSKGAGILGAFAMSMVLVLSVGATFVVSKILSKTLLKGTPSSFTLELPPFRPPKIIKTVTRSIFDRTLKVLGRAAVVAAPAGAVIWIFSNLTVAGAPLLSYITEFLDPFGKLLGFDGTLLASFLLALPANELVLPIALMAYLSSGTMQAEIGTGCAEILISNGWTVRTAVSAIIFTLFHFPCSTTLLTVKKETGSIKCMLFAAILPTAVGIILCTAVNLIWQGIAYLF